MSHPDMPDPAAVVAELAQQVRQRRGRAGGFPGQHQTAAGPDGNDDTWLVLLTDADADVPVASSRRALGPLAVAAKRAVRRAIGWYVRPLLMRQSAATLHLGELVNHLERRVKDLETAVAEKDRGSRRR